MDGILVTTKIKSIGTHEYVQISKKISKQYKYTKKTIKTYFIYKFTSISAYIIHLEEANEFLSRTAVRASASL